VREPGIELQRDSGSYEIFPEGDDLVILFTDGLHEVSNLSGDTYGEERLEETIRKRAGLEMQQLFGELLAEIQEFSARQELDDETAEGAL